MSVLKSAMFYGAVIYYRRGLFCHNDFFKDFCAKFISEVFCDPVLLEDFCDPVGSGKLWDINVECGEENSEKFLAQIGAQCPTLELSDGWRGDLISKEESFLLQLVHLNLD